VETHPDGTPSERPARTESDARRVRERRGLAVLAVGALATLFWIAQPVGVGLLLGVLTAFTMQPLYAALRRHTRPKPDVAAGLCVLLAGSGLLSVLGVFAYLIVERGFDAAAEITESFVSQAPVTRSVDWLAHRLAPLHIGRHDINARLARLVGDLAAWLTSMAASLAEAFVSAALMLFFLLSALHFTLKHWDRIRDRIEEVAPVHPRHVHTLLEEFRVVGRTVLLGTVATGLIQGVLAGIAYVIVGLPEAALLGAATAVASLVPVVGTLAVWVPAGMYLVLAGHVGAGVALLTYGSAVVVGVCDYGVRPRLVGGDVGTPTLATLVALFGGLEVFGPIGLILGPVVVSLALAVLRIYQREVTNEEVDRASA